MRIAFTLIGNSRRSNYLNGYTLRYGGGGGSGTDTSTILVAEYLALQGHDVVIATEKLEPELEADYARRGINFIPGLKIKGVTYTDMDFTNVDKNFDILVNSLWFEKYNELNISISKAVLYWCHMQWIYGIHELVNYCKTNNLKLGFINISNWEKLMNQETIDWCKKEYTNTYDNLIPNPIADDVINEVLNEQHIRKPHKFVFHAAWARGGDVAVEVLRKLNFKDKELHAFDYLLSTHDHEDGFFYRHNGVDKKTLFKHIAESEYFLYPLYTPYQDVHKDTFSCVVAEAIALGCTPITYPLGALPDYFNDFCIWIDPPEKCDLLKMQKESLSKDEEGIFKNNISKMVEKILELENKPEIKEKVKKEGRDFILNNFNTNKIGSMWVDFINRIVLS